MNTEFPENFLKHFLKNPLKYLKKIEEKLLNQCMQDFLKKVKLLEKSHMKLHEAVHRTFFKRISPKIDKLNSERFFERISGGFSNKFHWEIFAGISDRTHRKA